MNKFEKFMVLLYPSLRKKYKENIHIELDKQNKNLKMELLALKLGEGESEEKEINRVQDNFLT